MTLRPENAMKTAVQVADYKSSINTKVLIASGSSAAGLLLLVIMLIFGCRLRKRHAVRNASFGGEAPSKLSSNVSDSWLNGISDIRHSKTSSNSQSLRAPISTINTFTSYTTSTNEPQSSAPTKSILKSVVNKPISSKEYGAYNDALTALSIGKNGKSIVDAETLFNDIDIESISSYDRGFSSEYSVPSIVTTNYTKSTKQFFEKSFAFTNEDEYDSQASENWF